MSQENVELVRRLWEPFKGVDGAAVDWDGEAIREMTERYWSPDGAEVDEERSQGPRVSG
jgi:hypothetical protein